MDSLAFNRHETEEARASNEIPLPPPTRRPAWIEIDLDRLRRNFELIQAGKPRRVRFVSVVKDEAYGHGAAPVGRIALECGASFLAAVTLDEALSLRENGIRAPILLLGERHESELPWCLEHRLTCCVSTVETASALSRIARDRNQRAPVHLKIDTGMSRYGARWECAVSVAQEIGQMEHVALEGVFSHFAMSDELDKSFAHLQLERFQRVLAGMERLGLGVKYRHLCNSGGFLDLPQAHLDMVRLGILPLGVYPSQVCRRIPGLRPVMRVKARIACIRHVRKGDSIGYGMRFVASEPRRIAVLSIGYGDGFPRMRNQGHVLLHGRRAPLVGAASMDAITVDVTDIPQARTWDEAVLMGEQGEEEISVHDIARWKNSVSYDVLAGWRSRLPRVYLEKNSAA